MDTRATAQKVLKLFLEYRKRGPRKYGANTGFGMTGERDRSSTENPRSNKLSKKGLRPGRGRDRINPKKPIKSIVRP